MKIHEIAKELGLASKDVVKKAQELGYDITSHNNTLSEDKVATLKKALSKSEAAGETKIVKAAPKKKESTNKKDEGQPVVVKPAKIDPSVLTKSKNEKSSASKSGKTAEPKIIKLPPEPVPAQKKSVGETPIPRRIPKEELAPKRIPKEEIEKAKVEETKPEEIKTEKVKTEATKDDNANVEATKKTTDAKKEEEPKTKVGESKTNVEKTPDKKDDSKKDGKKATMAEPSPEQKKVEQKSDLKTAQPVRKTGKENVSKSELKHKAEPKKDDSKAVSSPTETSKEQQKKNKDKPKKGQKGKKDKKEYNEFGEKAKKKNPRQKNKGLVDDFKGSSKRPILEDNLLEKKPLKAKPKPKKQVVEPEPENEIIVEELAPGTVVINVPITVKGFAEQIKKTSSDIIMTLMKMGVMSNVNQNIDEDTVLLLGEELGVPIVIGKDEGEVIEEGLETFEDNPEDLVTRPPVITVMGHVDHGKTSLLDKIRETDVTKGEAGGITQHIGASEVTINGKRIVFLDTPGHEAFTAMRARGAHVTDIAILVVAADDSVKPQTLESINHAKAANVPIIVAINKIDKPGADPEKVKKDLADNGILVEDWGGETISVPVSAKSGEGIQDLLEMVLLQAEVLELKANPNRLAMGTVIEGRLDKSKGAVSTLLVLNGTLDSGMSIVAGNTSGRIRAMVDYKGKKLKSAGPATAVEVIGIDDVPQAGDEFHAVKDDKVAREIAENRRLKQREEVMTRTANTSLESLFSQIQDGEIKELNLIIKGDVQGSVGALTSSLEKLKNENVQIKIIHTGVGTVTESDVMLAETSGAIIIGFNVRPSTSVSNMAAKDNVEIRTYRIIYDVINDIEDAMEGMLDPEFEEVVLGKLEIRDTFKVPNIGIIGGAYVTEGIVQRNAEVRLVRDGIVIHEGKISSLKRFKDDVKEVAQGYECGIGIENYNDIKAGDIVEAFKMEEVKRGK